MMADDHRYWDRTATDRALIATPNLVELVRVCEPLTPVYEAILPDRR